ncbi:MAG TPA: hypothetical protein VHP60_06410 [Thermoanaerobaculia bacterium]|nr:hypothetical protein [Thermoanaerobaculia bacterium]
MRPAATRYRRGEGAFGLIVGLGVLFVVVVACVRILPLHIHGNEILDAMNEAANFGGLKGPEKLRMDIFLKAQDAKVPLKMDAIRVERNGTYITISAQYEQSADIFGYRYVYKFDKKVEKPVF